MSTEPASGSLPSEAAPRPRSRRLPKLAFLAVVVLGVGALAAWLYQRSRPEYRFARGREAVAAGQWDRAERFASDLAAAGEADRAAILRGDALIRQGRPVDAITVLNTVRDRGTLRLEAASLSGQAQLKLGNIREARRSFAFVVTENPDHIEAHRYLAAISFDLGQLDQALDHSEQVARLDPSDGRPYRTMGLINKDLAQLEPAEAAYREAMRRTLSDNARREVYLELAETLVGLTRFAEGLHVLDESLTVGTPRTAPWVMARVECLRGLNRQAEALSELDRGIADFPETGPLWRLRGQMELERSRAAEAVRALEQATKLAPADDQAFYLLGQAYTAQARPDDASKAFRRMDAIRADLAQITDLTKEAMDKPWDPAVRLRLAEVSDRLAKPDLAKMWRDAAAACRGTALPPGLSP